MKKLPLFLMLFLSLTFAAITGCSTPKQAQTVKIGVMPIEDYLPFYVAEKENLFQKDQINVELIPFASAQERDTALQAGQIDGEIADLVAVGLLKKGGTEIKVVSIGLGAVPQEGRFALLASPKSNYRDLKDLAGVEIGVSENSIIDYATDQMLADAGLTEDQIKKLSIPKLPVRKDLLLTDQIKAACLPDPLAALAEQQGARLIRDDTYKNISQTVVLFRTDSLNDKSSEIKQLLQIYGEAGQMLTANPEQYRSLVVEKANVPEPLQESYAIPKFSALQLPIRENYDSVMDWMVGKGLLSQKYSYEDLVTDEFIEKS
ncbi:NLPA lipoprotein [Syntrophobotulus glycolicus DSM 8271]|uniref:NLPA lipoprotein n=1 Tax=Syntrophobotulus glycolicus (strain DSM 8271 / FlGlyR) TaxID=645991 RepID=F0T048_SYNGF|nr:MetQ/NlpA family ABC transporter substrate-binding protein [Syntrophobotulus glycolicus]ADY56135.1 NLPA lipoprotein [Syntrophobotulus glycolicus DSM 8271]